jgi:capsid protein
MNALEYLDEDEDIEPISLSGDLPDAQSLIDFMRNEAGWSQGLSAMYSTGKADASYSASMAEANMTWMMFEWWQWFMTEYFFNWLAERAFVWGMDNGKITPASQSEWMDRNVWSGWPQPRAINPTNDANATKTKLEIGAITYEDIHGPDWKRKLSGLGEQIRWSRDNGLFVPMWTPKTGARNG